MKFLTQIVCVVLVGVSILLWLQRQDNGISDKQANSLSKESGTNQPVKSAIDSPFAVLEPAAALSRSETVVVKSSSEARSEVDSDTTLPADTAPTDWQASRSDAELLVLVDRFKLDSEALQQLIDSYRQEHDPGIRENMAAILGLVGGEQVTSLASELIFSGAPEQRTEGMDLLQAVQPGNAAARDIVSGMLATEVEPTTLVNALTVLAEPGEVDDQSRAWLSEQVAWLADHEDENVRGISLNILGRWTNDNSHTDVFLSALDDQSRHVRTAAVYALQNQADSPLVVDQLFRVLAQSDEHRRVRSAAALALKSKTLTIDQAEELERLQTSLFTRPRTR